MEVRRALIVGIDDYLSAPLTGCVNDARAVHELVQRHHDGTPNFSSRLLTGEAGTPVTRAQLRQEIGKLLGSPGDVALFYFSGHGTMTSTGGHLVTSDAAAYDEGITMSDVLAQVNKAEVAHVVVVIDACHSGAMGHVPATGSELANLRLGVSVLTAARDDENALEISGRGLFTTLFSAALDGGAADILGHVTVAGIYSYLDQALGPWDQRPLFKAHESTLVTLRGAQPSVAPANLRHLINWFVTAEAEFALDPSFEPDAEPSNPDHERIFAVLQKCRAAKLVEPVGEEHLYFAAMKSKSCRLTPLGRLYWLLASEGRI